MQEAADVGSAVAIDSLVESSEIIKTYSIVWLEVIHYAVHIPTVVR